MVKLKNKIDLQSGLNWKNQFDFCQEHNVCKKIDF